MHPNHNQVTQDSLAQLNCDKINKLLGLLYDSHQSLNNMKNDYRLDHAGDIETCIENLKNLKKLLTEGLEYITEVQTELKRKNNT